MTLADLRRIAYRANMDLASSGLVLSTFGNVSAVDRRLGLCVIKPSGVPYEELTEDDMVPVSLETGEVVDSALRPSSDTPTHVELYRAFEACGAIVHTHSEFATMFAQARVSVRCMGTTHADYFHGDIPVTRPMHRDEVERDYERNTGLVIVETFKERGVTAEEMPAVLVANHGPFAWGPSASKAIEHAQVLEYVARLDWRARQIAPEAPRPDTFLVEKHYRRKHGPLAYYGQK